MVRDLEEVECLKDCFEELCRNIRGLEECLDKERFKGDGNFFDYLCEKNKLYVEFIVLK